ncbi:MAG: hypothetical protein ACRCWO_10570 [Bosea sp. (in: a-proteobacteria)]
MSTDTTLDCTTLDGAFLSGVTAADVAIAMRRQLAAEPEAPKKGDGLLAGLVLGAMLAGAIITGMVVWKLTPQSAPIERQALIRIGEEWLTPPLALMGPAPEDVSHEAGILRLRLGWPALGPAKGNADIHIAITPRAETTDPAEQLKTWSRFLTPTAWSNPGGLVVRSFRKGTAFEADELYLALPDGRGFAALCPVLAPAQIGAPKPMLPEEPCRTLIRHGNLDVAMRFPRAALADWQKLTNGVKGLVDSIKR